MSSREEILEQYRSIYNKEDGVFNQLKKEHENEHFTINDHTGKKSRICFIFSCPGQEELIYGKVCYGETGENLDSLLRILKEQKGDVFTSDCRYDYDILNASDAVHFYALDKKTEAGAREIKKESNIQRIRNYIESNEKLNYIIMFGKKSDSLYKVLQEFISLKNTTIKLIKDIPHLGYQSLNRISEDVDDDTINEEHYDSSKARTEARLKVVAKRIIEQI